MKRINNSQPLAVITQFKPLSTSFHIEVLGGLSVMQFYQSATQQWSPNHAVAPVINDDGSQEDGTLRLKASYSLIDPDGIIGNASLEPQVFWFVDGAQIVTNDVTADYYVSENVLHIRKNFTHLKGANVYCECRFTDIRNGQTIVLSDTLVLSAILQADEQWQLSMVCDRTKHYNPLYADSPVIFFQAEARLGANIKTDSVSWYWDYSLDNGLTWNDIDSSCYWYVSGKTAPTLKVNMDYIEAITVRARIEEENIDKLMPCEVTASCAWRMPVVRPMVFSYSGNRVTSSTDLMTFGVNVHVPKHADLSEEEKRKWLIFDWCVREQGANSTPVFLGEHNTECTISAQQLFNNDNRKYVIDPNISMRTIYGILADSKGNIIQIKGNPIAVRS